MVVAPVGTGFVGEHAVAFAVGGSAAVLDPPRFEKGEEDAEVAHLNHVAETAVDLDPYQGHRTDLHDLGVVLLVFGLEIAAVDHQAIVGVAEVQVEGISAGWVEKRLLGHGSGLGLRKEPGPGEQDGDSLVSVEGTVGVGVALEDPVGP